ncbi:MAG: GNAT family N-acetyltransferase [Candidatus Brocadiaceae bacterium]|jgi:GNAT superfamily N-acetyltransferase
MIRVRAARPEDVETIVGFQLRMARETEAIELEPETVTAGVRAVFADPGKGFYRVAEVNGEVAGSLLVTSEWSDWRDASVWWIQSLYVRPDHRRQGVFRALFEHVSGLVRDREDVVGIRLYVAADNVAAQRAYEVLGMYGDRYRLYEWME